MTSIDSMIITDEKLRSELSSFFNEISDDVINKLKDLCVIHDINEDNICAQLLSFLMSKEIKELSLEVIEGFQSDCLDKKALKEVKKAKTPNRPKAKSSALKASMACEGINLLLTQLNEPKESKKTTEIEMVVDESGDEQDRDQDQDHASLAEQQSTERTIIIDERLVGNDENECLDAGSQSSPTNEMDETINTSLKCPHNSNVLCYLGSQLSEYDWINRSKAKHQLKYFDTAFALKYKFMSLKLFESNEILNDRIDEFSEQLQKDFDIDGWSQFSSYSPSESYYIGRVTHDCTQTKLDEQSIRFETSNYISNNESIGLDLSHLEAFSLFSGQILGCKAINESGKSLFVKELLDFSKILGLPKEMPTFTQSIHLVVGVGPFSSNHSLEYESLQKLMKYVKQYEPDFCILIGPFLDSTNEKLMSTEQPIDQLLRNQMRYISDQLSDIKTEAIIIPSTRDINVFNVFPTMPFDNAFQSSNIHYFANPSVLDISGVVLGVTATDVLLHMSKEEISLGQTSDRLSRLCNHIITQKNFYPIFPPNPEINLEFTKYDSLCLPVTPHVLIVPSDLKEFVKTIAGSVVINSGRLSKSKFCRIRIDPFDQNSYKGSLESYTNVEIIKIDA